MTPTAAATSWAAATTSCERRKHSMPWQLPSSAACCAYTVSKVSGIVELSEGSQMCGSVRLLDLLDLLTTCAYTALQRSLAKRSAPMAPGVPSKTWPGLGLGLGLGLG